VLVTLTGCSSDNTKGADSLARADAAASKLGEMLKANLVEAMANGGPESAVSVCAAQAQSILGEIETASHVKVGRSSLRLRTPADAPPDWVATWLRTAGERKAEGVVGVRAVVDSPSDKVARVIRPIAIEAPCLACHGQEQQVSPATRAAIRATYPQDAAMGYDLGDLRGALWAEVAVQ
jgi:hypothetical protein